jgi:uncharacterized protein YndB with AHSA1/START domain
MDHAVAERTGFNLRLRHRFNASRQKVFQAWTKPEALKRWWCPPGWFGIEFKSNFQEGGRYTFTMQRESDAAIVTAYGTFLEIIVPSRIVYTWNWDGAFDDMPETTIEVDFIETSDGTELVFEQVELPMRVCGRHLVGWLQAFARLSNMMGLLT